MPFSFATPEEVAELSAALERAWAILEQRRPADPVSASGDRERLAYLIATLWQRDFRERLAEEAVEQFEITAPARMGHEVPKSSR